MKGFKKHVLPTVAAVAAVAGFSGGRAARADDSSVTPSLFAVADVTGDGVVDYDDVVATGQLQASGVITATQANYIYSAIGVVITA